MTFFMFGKYSGEALEAISPKRTATARELVKKLGGKVKDIYALLGQYDLVLIVELPTMTDAMKAAVALGRETGISFCTAPAMTVADFDKLMVEA
ncbi:MAG: GYD domain-containing protein [Candidatus Anammoximicrobium sp.]|nr:GYD domain-containing protein [Candidatus Anammoximicrobium sp.]